MACSSTSMVDRHHHPVVESIRATLSENQHDELPLLIHECMNEYRDGNLDRRCYAEAIRLLKQDPRCSDMCVKIELGICPLITASPRRPPTPTYLNALYNGVCSAGRSVAGQIFNYHHPWKMQKYTLVLQELRRNLETHHLTPVTFLERAAKPMTHINAAVYTVLNAVFTPDFELYRDDRERYQQGFVQGLRGILSLPEFSGQPSQDKAAFAVHYLVLYRYTGVHLFNWQKDLVELFVREGRRSLLTYYDLDEEEADRENVLQIPLEWQFQGIDFAPKSLKARPADLQLGKFRGHAGIDFDPSGRNRIPSGGYEWGPCINLQIGTPTIQPLTWTDQTTIAPEFDQFIAALKLQSQSLLYINLQINFGEGAEKSRTDQLVKLQAKYPTTMKLVMFDMDSTFYNQKSSTMAMPIDAFTTDYMEHLFHPLSPYCIPGMEKEFVQGIFEEIKAVFFPTNAVLERSERLQFIDLFHALLALTYIQKYSAKYFTTVCKDGLDRAGSLNALMRDFIFLLEDMENDSITKLYQSVFIHAPPIMSKKIAMLAERRNRYLSVLDLLSDPDVKMRAKELVKRRFRSYGKLKVELLPNQQLNRF